MEEKYISEPQATVTNYLEEKYGALRNYLAAETAGSKLVLYGISGSMLLWALKKRRPNYIMRHFKKPQHIPHQLVAQSSIHTATVQGIRQQEQQTLLVVEKPPFLGIFKRSGEPNIIKLSGVEVNSNGLSWLHNCLVGRVATFLPLEKQDRGALCLLHPKQHNQQSLLDISETLVQLGFAHVKPDAVPTAARYYKYLKRIEKQAKWRDSFYNWAARHPIIWNILNDLQALILPKQRLLPKLLR